MNGLFFCSSDESDGDGVHGTNDNKDAGPAFFSTRPESGGKKSVSHSSREVNTPTSRGQGEGLSIRAQSTRRSENEFCS